MKHALIDDVLFWIHSSIDNQILFQRKTSNAGNSQSLFHFLESVSYHHSHQAKTLLRLPVYKTPGYTLSISDKLALKIFAKRMAGTSTSFQSYLSSHTRARLSELSFVSAPHFTINGTVVFGLKCELQNLNAEIFETLDELTSKTQTSESCLVALNRITQSLSDGASSAGNKSLPKRVGAALLSAEGQATQIAFNMPTLAYPWHAEALLLRNLDSVPAGSLVVSTLKPCRFCASLIHQKCSGKGSETIVNYGHFDSGRQAKETLLNARSPDQVRFNLISNSDLEKQLPL